MVIIYASWEQIIQHSASADHWKNGQGGQSLLGAVQSNQT